MSLRFSSKKHDRMMKASCSRIINLIVWTFFFSMTLSQCTTTISRKKPSKETNIFNFFRLMLFRVIYGFAAMFGAQETFSEIMGGVLVPPGADDDDGDDADYRDYLDEDDKDYDYDY